MTNFIINFCIKYVNYNIVSVGDDNLAYSVDL